MPESLDALYISVPETVKNSYATLHNFTPFYIHLCISTYTSMCLPSSQSWVSSGNFVERLHQLWKQQLYHVKHQQITTAMLRKQVKWPHLVWFCVFLGVNLMVQDLLRQVTRIQDLYFNISEMKLPITSLFSVQLMSYLGASDILYSDVIDSFISEILKNKSWIFCA